MKFDIRKRDKEIWEMRKNRYTLREVGEKFGVTKERVRQIVAKEDERNKYK